MMKKAEIKLDEDKIDNIIQNALEKTVTENRTVYNEDQLFELLGRIKLVENIAHTLALKAGELLKE